MPNVPVRVGEQVYMVPAAFRPSLGNASRNNPKYPSQGRDAGLAIVCLGKNQHLSSSDTGLSIAGGALRSQGPDGEPLSGVTWFNIDEGNLDQQGFPSTPSYAWRGFRRVDRGVRYFVFGESRTGLRFAARCLKDAQGDPCRLFVRTTDPGVLLTLDLDTSQPAEAWPAIAAAAEALRVDMKQQ